MSKTPSSRPKLTPQVPGATSAPTTTPNPPAEPLPTVPESFLAEIGALDNEGLIALDTAERGGENRPEYLAAVDAELKKRIAAQTPPAEPPAVKAQDPDQLVADAAAAASIPSAPGAPVAVVPARVGLPHAADIDPSKIATAVLCIEGWVLPSTAVPPPIR